MHLKVCIKLDSVPITLQTIHDTRLLVVSNALLKEISLTPVQKVCSSDEYQHEIEAMQRLNHARCGRVRPPKRCIFCYVTAT